MNAIAEMMNTLISFVNTPLNSSTDVTWGLVLVFLVGAWLISNMES